MTNATQNPFVKRFYDHAIHAAIEQLIQKLKTERPANFRNLDYESRNAFVRLCWVLRELQTRLVKLNPFLGQPTLLDTINRHIATFQTPWLQYSSNPTQHWEQLNLFTNGIIAVSSTLLVTNGSKAWQETLEQLRNDMEGVINDARSAILSLQTSAGTTDDKFKEANDKLQQLMAEIQVQKPRLDQMLTQQSEAFIKSEQDRVTLFSQAEQDRIQKFNQFQDEKKTQFDALVSDFGTQKSIVDPIFRTGICVSFSGGN